MTDPLVSAFASDEDLAVDQSVRPKRLAELIGQHRVREQLDLLLQSALRRVSADELQLERAHIGRFVAAGRGVRHPIDAIANPDGVAGRFQSLFGEGKRPVKRLF